MRELKVDKYWTHSKDYIVFLEDGTYRRSWSAEVLYWKLCPDSGLLLYYNKRDSDSRTWHPFLVDSTPIVELSATIRAWVDEMEFYDSMDKVLSESS